MSIPDHIRPVITPRIDAGPTNDAQQRAEEAQRQRESHRELQSFMRRSGDYQQARNLNSEHPAFTGSPLAHVRKTETKPSSFPHQPPPHDPRKVFPAIIKPFPFALEKGDGGAAIWWGMLAARITIINATRFDGKITSITQPPLQKPEYLAFSNLENEPNKPTQLDWWGNVYAYWEATDGGAVSAMEIKGPDQPDGEDIGELGVDLSRAITDGKYWVKIGNCPEEGDIDQQISSDIPWFITSVKGGSGGGSDSDGSEGSDGSSSGSTGSPGSTGSLGSDKSTAIVPVSFYSTGFTALFTVESPDVRFEDVFADLKIRGRTTRYLIDERFIEVIHADTLRVVGICGDKPYAVGAVIEGGHLVVHALSDKRRRPNIIQVKFSAIRKGFKGMRFPTRTKAQFEANEKFLNSAYPRK